MNLNRVITLSAIAFLIFQPYGTLALHVVENKWGTDMLTIGLLAFLVINGSWLWGLLTAARGNRLGLVAALFANLIPALGSLSDVLVFCPSPCQGVWYPNTVSHWATLISGLIAIAAVGAYLKGTNRE